MNIKQTLTDGGLYSPLYDIQIEQTEMAKVDIAQSLLSGIIMQEKMKV